VTTKLLSLFLSVVLGAITAVVAAQLDNRPEQRQFSAEDESVQVPVAIPQGIRKNLAGDEMVREATSYDHIDPEEFPAAWFSASMVHLGSSIEEDFVLVGRGPMVGANITQFWVFRATTRGYRLVLQASAHDLIVMNKVRNGFREIELLSATGIAVRTVLLRFDGERYKVVRDKWESTQ
jgi:hypothetical protein